MLVVFFLVLMVLLSVAFFTLLERKILGYIHFRKGPNKSGILGILQPFSDAVKLFCKEQVYPLNSNLIVYYYSPFFNLFLALLLWFVIPYFNEGLIFNLAMLYVLLVSSLGVYAIMFSGWASNSNYSMLGGIRAVAQMISYEVSLILILLSYFFFTSSYSLVSFILMQNYVWFFVLMIPLSLMLIVSFFAETNRSPFDFAEGESELVSGFNVEYSSGGFALIFLSEYSNILFCSYILAIIILGMDWGLVNYLKVLLFVFIWIWVRGSFPRFRYDKLMYLAWKIYLPSSLTILWGFLGVFLFLYFFYI
uniref:NADH-ubiquinone oxidoreductase chain 1 n=1 Tax=Curculionidae sp. BMNH 1040049 TaxID=1903777 RepID=A0A343A5X5_9CUCU|nr:NADH dehydrogenase subunit 1 [Curculionidae sp. BMNH 1040049]